MTNKRYTTRGTKNQEKAKQTTETEEEKAYTEKQKGNRRNMRQTRPSKRKEDEEESIKTRQANRMRARAKPSVDGRGTYEHARARRSRNMRNRRGRRSGATTWNRKNLSDTPKAGRTQPPQISLLRSAMARFFAVLTRPEAIKSLVGFKPRCTQQAVVDRECESYPGGRAFKKPPTPA